MNKTITDGIVFQPTVFADGLDVWSSQNGRPGQDTYDQSSNAAFVPADADFGGCLELQKTSSVTKLRYTAETPIQPGCYLQITVRLKVLSGAFPSARIAAWAGGAGNANVITVNQVGPSVSLDQYNSVYTIQAIVGSGDRGGVDMVWGTEPIFGHFGLDLTGPNGSVVRIDDIDIEDISTIFQNRLVSRVDVVDYGAIPDGVTDNRAAFEAADAAADGREVFVPSGEFYIGGNLTIDNRVEFHGTVTMPDDKRLVLAKNFDLPGYIDAFGDEVLAFKKAFQALMNFSDHESLNMGGRRIRLSEPIDMQAALATATVFEVRRVVRNGQFVCDDSPAWDTDIVTSQGTYSVSDPFVLTGVSNVANIQIGSLVEGVGVGREIYVNAVDVAQNTVTLTQALYDAEGTQVFTFKRFKYALDFSGFTELGKFVLDQVELQCNSRCSGIMLALEGSSFEFRDSYLTKPKDRGITSAGLGCSGLVIEGCQWTSSELSLPVSERTSIGFNQNSNDLKCRNNLIIRFKHFGVIGGGGAIISGNHYFHGDTTPNGPRKGGLVFATTNVKSFVTGNYIDNNFIEWTNEYEAEPENASQFTFGGLTITGNVFTANDVAPWFNFIVIKPYGPDHTIRGLSVVGNVFRSINGQIDRVDYVDTTFADLNYTAMRNITFEGNTFDNVNDPVFNPYRATHTEESAQKTWVLDLAPHLPFGGNARFVESLTAISPITQSSGQQVTDMPYVTLNRGPDSNQLHVTWREACKGEVSFVARMDKP